MIIELAATERNSQTRILAPDVGSITYMSGWAYSLKSPPEIAGRSRRVLTENASDSTAHH
jgi:hypothetical protein